MVAMSLGGDLQEHRPSCPPRPPSAPTQVIHRRQLTSRLLRCTAYFSSTRDLEMDDGVPCIALSFLSMFFVTASAKRPAQDLSGKMSDAMQASRKLQLLF